jgi:hypothetical protein
MPAKTAAPTEGATIAHAKRVTAEERARRQHHERDEGDDDELPRILGSPYDPQSTRSAPATASRISGVPIRSRIPNDCHERFHTLPVATLSTRTLR